MSDDVEVKIIKKLDHECDVCKKGFIDKNYLKRHKRFVLAAFSVVSPNRDMISSGWVDRG